MNVKTSRSSVALALWLFVSLALIHTHGAHGASVSVFSKDIGAPVRATQVGSGFAVQPEVSNRKPVGTAVNDYATTPAPTGSFISILTVSDDFHQLGIFDSSGSVLTLKLLQPDAAVSLYTIEPGGPGLTPIGAPSGTILSVKSAGAANVTSGLLILNALK